MGCVWMSNLFSSRTKMCFSDGPSVWVRQGQRACSLGPMRSQGLVGEHSLPHEPWLATTRRALMEELGLPKSVVAAQRPLVMRGERGEASVLVRTEYTETNRRELQATALVAVVLPDDIIPLIRPDDEVAEMKWQTYGRVPNSSPSFGAGIDTDYGIHRMRRG